MGDGLLFDIEEYHKEMVSHLFFKIFSFKKEANFLRSFALEEPFSLY
jgi:hypothetical protein